MIRPEFSRPLPFAAVRAPGHTFEAVALAPERAALADRLGVIELPSFSAHWRLTPEETGGVAAQVRIEAEVVQACVVTLDPVSQRIVETVRLRFLPPGQVPADEDPETPDEIACERDVMDLGEAAAETLALLLDPYPRAEGAVLPAEASDDEQGAFAALVKLVSKPR